MLTFLPDFKSVVLKLCNATKNSGIIEHNLIRKDSYFLCKETRVFVQ
jgi:hypothetical protein